MGMMSSHHHLIPTDFRVALNWSYIAKMKSVFAFSVVRGHREIKSTVPSSHLFTNLSALQPAWHGILTQERQSECLGWAGGSWQQSSWSWKTEKKEARQHSLLTYSETSCGICSTGERRARLSLVQIFNDASNPYNNYIYIYCGLWLFLNMPLTQFAESNLCGWKLSTCSRMMVNQGKSKWRSHFSHL